MAGILVVQQPGQRADHAALGLSALAEKDHILLGQQRILERRHDGVLIAVNLREEWSTGFKPLDQVVSYLFPNGSRLITGFL